MEPNDSIRITLIGDIFPGELSFTKNYGIRSQFKKHKGALWIKEIRKILGENDIVIGNLESPLISENGALKKTFHGDPEFASFLKESGINVLNIANNHILEHGDLGFKNTVQALHKAELDIVGDIVNSKSKIVYKDIKGLRISIAGFSNVDLHEIENKDHFAVLKEEHVLNSLKEMEDHKADIKILCFHWGNEYIHVPSLEQRKMAYKFIDNGADIIVGHHPHVIQPYEAYKHGHIFYSLGNFIFDFLQSRMVSTGLVATLRVTAKKQVHVNLNGVKLSYKNTVTLLPLSKFEKFYSMVTKKYNKITYLSDEKYKNYYRASKIKNRLKQRVLMKTSLIIEFFRVNKRDKMYLLKNVMTYYFSLRKNI